MGFWLSLAGPEGNLLEKGAKVPMQFLEFFDGSSFSPRNILASMLSLYHDFILVLAGRWHNKIDNYAKRRESQHNQGRFPCNVYILFVSYTKDIGHYIGAMPIAPLFRDYFHLHIIWTHD